MAVMHRSKTSPEHSVHPDRRDDAFVEETHYEKLPPGPSVRGMRCDCVFGCSVSHFRPFPVDEVLCSVDGLVKCDRVSGCVSEDMVHGDLVVEPCQAGVV